MDHPPEHLVSLENMSLNQKEGTLVKRKWGAFIFLEFVTGWVREPSGVAVDRQINVRTWVKKRLLEKPHPQKDGWIHRELKRDPVGI